MKISLNVVKTFFFVAFLVKANLVSAAVLYSNDFDGHTTIASGVVVNGLTNGTLEAAKTGFGNWSGSYFANRSTGNPATMSTLTLTNLGQHTSVNINFLLGFLESWDSSNGHPSASPDYLDFYIDGNHAARLTANNATGSHEIFAGGTELFDNVQLNSVIGYGDTLVDMSTAGFLSFAHTGTSLTFGIQASGSGWQGVNNEAWGIDDLVIEYNAVPEPLPLALIGAGLIGMTFFKRRIERMS